MYGQITQIPSDFPRANDDKASTPRRFVYPVCPECGCNTIVAFTPPKKGIVGTAEGYRTTGTPEYVDWNNAHLYCANGNTDCNFRSKFSELTTPVGEPRQKYRLANPDAELLNKLMEVELMRYCGERGVSEGMVDTLRRIIRERDLLLKKVIENLLAP